jgi:hypothetical protein
MIDWNGREIASARSRGGVQVVAHPLDNLISTGCSPWPTSEIVQKLYQSRQESAFDDEQRKTCTSSLGYYCDLQSLHSEDAITWSVFGTISRSDQRLKEAWIADLLKLLCLPAEISPNGAEVSLWRRIPHPDNHVSGGPEIDFCILTENAVVLGEAKWKSAVGEAQGKMKDKDQIQLRGEFLEKYGDKVFPQCRYPIVLGLSLYDKAFENTVPDGVIFKMALWKDACNLQSHQLSDEVKRYYAWKVNHSKLNNKAPVLMS